jgi:mono/diheme cytochrome c family protein
MRFQTSIGRVLDPPLRLIVLAAGALLVSGAARWGVAVPVSAQTETPKIWTGIYTDAQAARGEAAYGSMCSRCHSVDLAGSQVAANFAPALGGDKFMAAWETRPLDRLFKTIRDTMPRGTPGLLNEQGALDVVAYLLKFNGYPSSETPLVASAELEQTLILPKAGAVKREVVNFAMVQVTGCVTRAETRWALTHASTPVVATLAKSGAATAASSGSETFRLINAAPFKVEAQAGRVVQIEGLIRRDPDESVLNVTSLVPTGAACGN